MFSNKKIFDLICILFIAILLLVFYSEGLTAYFGNNDWGELVYREHARNRFYITHPRIISPSEYYAIGQPLRPVKYLFLDLMHSVFGANPLVYHVILLSLHLINSLFVFFFIKRITGERIVGFLACCLYVSFWTHSEVLLSPVALHDALPAYFCIYCLIFFYNYRVNPTWLNYLLTLLVFVLAIGSRENVAVSLPPLLYFTDRYIQLELEGTSVRTSLSKATYIPFLLLAIVWVGFVMLHPRAAHEVKSWLDGLNNLSNFVRAITFSFSFPLFCESPRFGIINLILIAIFYLLSPTQIKSHVSLLMASMAIVCLPYSLLSPTARHLYFSTIFSTAIFTILLYYGTIELSKKVRVTKALCKLVVVSYISLMIYSNYVFVNKQIKDYRRFGSVQENILISIATAFPRGTSDTHLIFINYPTLGSEASRYCRWYTFGVWGPVHPLLLGYYGKGKVGTVSEECTLLELWDTASNFWKLPDRKTISPAEFEELTKGIKNKVYLFDPKCEKIHDVTGCNFLQAKELLN